ncbi:MAG: DUF423 domain-containing protein [Chitinophagaceae bacterium]|nr:DUF423 domain-containing protein [Chitinophagaceae bacterium]MCW5913336.1 DUF423 domain-containing protein [Chitinophagaceae bacterium]
MQKNFFMLAALIGALAVALGAFGAHGLKRVASEDVVAVFETGVRYQFYHVFALLATALSFGYGNERLLKWAGRFFLLGILLFSGSLYLITLFKVQGVEGMSWIGPVTPLGGVCLIAAWVLLFSAIAKGKLKK